MPRRQKPDALARAVGKRLGQLREEAGLTLEKLAYESELGSKGHLSDIERGLVRPTIHTLKVIADHLQIDVIDVINIPSKGERHELVDLTRRLAPETLRRLLRQAREALKSG